VSETSITGAAVAIDFLLHTCREGRFYEDHDESLAMLADAEEALAFLADAASVPAVPTEQLRAAIRFLGNSDITPMGRRILESICEEHEADGEH
jgi:hypothetical protein